MKSSPTRYELTDAQWEHIKPHLSSKVGHKAKDNRQFLHAVLWNTVLCVARSGAAWRDLPECYRKWNTVFVHYNRWSKQGRWQKLWSALVEEENSYVPVPVYRLAQNTRLLAQRQ